MKIASDMCVYTNNNFVWELMATAEAPSPPDPLAASLSSTSTGTGTGSPPGS